MKRNTKKLTLDRQTVRVLVDSDLAQAKGGYPVKTDRCPPSDLASALC